MTTQAAIAKLTALGWVKFPKPETRSPAAIKKSIMRREGGEKPYVRPYEPPGPIPYRPPGGTLGTPLAP